MPSLLKNKYGPLLRCDLLCAWCAFQFVLQKTTQYVTYWYVLEFLILFVIFLFCFISQITYKYFSTHGLETETPLTISCCLCNFSLLLFLFTLQIHKCYSHFTVAATSATFNIPTLGLLHGIPNSEQAFCTHRPVSKPSKFISQRDLSIAKKQEPVIIQLSLHTTDKIRILSMQTFKE